MSSKTTVDGVDYGPLVCLIGTWKGDKGVDIAPEPDGKEENPFYETILFEAIGDVTNAEEQALAALRYHQVVSRKSNNQVFHNETGYWMWDASANVVMQSLTIPRGVCLLAGGTPAGNYEENNMTIEVIAALDDERWGIIQSPFMKEKAKTLKFNHSVTVNKDELKYFETTVLDIYGKTFDHTDGNTLTRL